MERLLLILPTHGQKQCSFWTRIAKNISYSLANGSTISSISSASPATFDVTVNVRQDLLSHPNFQIRLQFDKYSSGNGTADYLIFPASQMKLSVNCTD